MINLNTDMRNLSRANQTLQPEEHSLKSSFVVNGPTNDRLLFFSSSGKKKARKAEKIHPQEGRKSKKGPAFRNDVVSSRSTQ
jgi:hypothetical protein